MAAAEQGETGAPAARLGAELRAAREQRGWTLPELAQGLRIRQVYLEAIESGRVRELPGPTYAMGFLRTYAAALGMPAEDVAQRFRREAHVERHVPLTFPVPVPQRGVPAGALMLVGVVVLGLAYAGWWWVTEHGRTPAETVPPIPDRLAQTVGPPPSPQVASMLPATAPPSAATVPAPPATPVASPPAGASAPAKPAPAPAPVPATTPPAAGSSVTQTAAAPAPAPAPAPVAAAPPATPAGTRIVIRATADAWVTVKPPGGAAVFNRLMHAGDSWPVPAASAGLLLTTGNAGGTTIDVDGATLPPLGGSGAVKRNVRLDADALKAGGAARPPAAETPR